MSDCFHQNINNEKMFLINIKDIDGRYDPEFYRSRKKLTERFIYPLDKISNSFFIKDGDHDKLPEDAVSNALIGKRYLRSQDLKNNEIVSDNPVFVRNEYFESVTRCHIYPGDLLFSIMASIGATAIVPNNFSVCMANRAVGILRAKKDAKFLPEYVQVLFNSNIGADLLNIHKRGGIQKRINLSDVAELQLPAPDITTQKKIVETYNNSLDVKKEKENNANRLLASIDDYLLSELGIPAQQQEDNSLEKRIFIRKYSDVAGKRLAPLFYSGNLYQFIDNSIFPFFFVGELVAYMKSGFASGKQDQANAKNGIIQIRPTNINDDRSFVFDRNIYIDKAIVETRSADILVSGEVLFNNTNSQILVGKSIFFDLNGDYCCSNHITRVMPDEGRVSAEYLTLIFNLYQRNKLFYKICTNWNNQSGVNVEQLAQVKIPVPPLEKQREMVAHIVEIRQQAKQLREEAARELEQAKVEVERMILGR